MTNKTTEVFESKNSNYSSTSVERALKLAEEALQNYGIEGTKSVAGIKCTEALAAIREALAEPDTKAGELHAMKTELWKAEPMKPQKERQDFIDGYTAGMADAKRMQANAEPVKQEPVAWSIFNKRTKKHWYTNESKYTAQHYANEYGHRESDNSLSMVVVPLYAAPVSCATSCPDAKAIQFALANARAEALEEAAKVQEQRSIERHGYDKYKDAEVIRGLK